MRALFLCVALLLSSRVFAEPDLGSTIQRACEILVQNQENYTPDAPVGKLPDAGLAKWQEGEKARLSEIRKKSAGDAGEWPYEGVYRIRPDGRIPPGYRVGGTAIVCEALLEAPGRDEIRAAAILRGIRFMLDAIHNDDGMKPRRQSNYDVRGWGQAYALKFFLRVLETKLPKDALRGEIRKTVPHLIASLKEGQVNGGGWNYAGRGVSPFMTGSTLLALFHAREAGFAVDSEMVEAALSALESGRGASIAYAYSGKLRKEDEPMAGASARSALAELCLFKAGRSSETKLRKAIDGFFDDSNWRELLKRKSKQGTHERPYGVAPYYFFFGHTYAALAVEHLPENARPEYRTKMRDLLLRTIEPHGGWNDRIFPRTESYSTAMAVLSLIAKDLPQVVSWPNSSETGAGTGRKRGRL